MAEMAAIISSSPPRGLEKWKKMRQKVFPTTFLKYVAEMKAVC
jgi:hypothetical protein